MTKFFFWGLVLASNKVFADFKHHAQQTTQIAAI
jgi:hypothetical protein